MKVKVKAEKEIIQTHLYRFNSIIKTIMVEFIVNKIHISRREVTLIHQ
jgi:hypothetical protein